MSDALVLAVLVEAFGYRFDGPGIDEVMSADGDRAGTGQHEFYGILPSYDAAEA